VAIATQWLRLYLMLQNRPSRLDTLFGRRNKVESYLYMTKKSYIRILLSIVLLILLCCILPEEMLFWRLCSEQDQNIPANTEVIVSPVGLQQCWSTGWRSIIG